MDLNRLRLYIYTCVSKIIHISDKKVLSFFKVCLSYCHYPLINLFSTITKVVYTM